MFNTNIELCLDAFSFAERAYGAALDRKALFGALSAVFLIDKAEADELFEKLDRERVREVDSLDKYYRYMRIREFCAASDGDCGFDAAEAEILKIKGKMLKRSFDKHLIAATDASASEVGRELFDRARLGSMPCAFLAGVLQCEGIMMPKNRASGLTLINRAAKWNRPDGVFGVLYYDEAERRHNIDRLFSIVDGTPDEGLCALAEAKYGIEHGEKLADTVLLEKVFMRGNVKRDEYNQHYARVIYGRLLFGPDKERLMLTDGGALISATCELPVKLQKRPEKPRSFEETGLVLDRPEERAAVLRALVNGDLRDVYEYRPLCLSSESDYLLEAYARAVHELLPNAHVVRIEASELCINDFDLTKDNIFIDNCDEDSDNVYLLFIRGKVEPDVAARMHEFLSVRRRKYTRLRAPSVTVDLTAILPVCFCDGKGARILGSDVELVKLAAVTAEEKPDVVRDIVRRKGDYFGVEVELDNAATELLLTVAPDAVAGTLDRAILAKRSGAKLELTAADIKDFIDSGSARGNHFGFGGADNGNR